MASITFLFLAYSDQHYNKTTLTFDMAFELRRRDIGGSFEHRVLEMQRSKKKNLAGRTVSKLSSGKVDHGGADDGHAWNKPPDPRSASSSALSL